MGSSGDEDTEASQEDEVRSIAALQEFPTALEELLHRDPVQRPTAAAVVTRPITISCLRSVFAKAGIFSKTEHLENHMDEVDMVIEASIRASMQESTTAL